MAGMMGDMGMGGMGGGMDPSMGMAGGGMAGGGSCPTCGAPMGGGMAPPPGAMPPEEDADMGDSPLLQSLSAQFGGGGGGDGMQVAPGGLVGQGNGMPDLMNLLAAASMRQGRGKGPMMGGGMAPGGSGVPMGGGGLSSMLPY